MTLWVPPLQKTYSFCKIFNNQSPRHLFNNILSAIKACITQQIAVVNAVSEQSI